VFWKAPVGVPPRYWRSVTGLSRASKIVVAAIPPALAHLRNGHAYARLAGGSGIGVTTVCRYVHEAIELLATTAPTLTQITRRVAALTYTIGDRTLIPIDRLSGSADRRYCTGKHKQHGVDVQIQPPTGGSGLGDFEGGGQVGC
jgi:hypothetical protein